MLECDNAFWRFSLKVYGAPGVAAECLELQETLGVDVNVLLFCAWVGAQGRLLNDDAMTAVETGVRGWHDAAVRPLRAVRQGMKSMPEMAHADVAALRKDVAAVELRAEQIEQAMLFAALPALGPLDAAAQATAVPANIGAQLRRRGALYTTPERLISEASRYRAE
ncbi:MAG: TIGR02444 family protein [Pseudolabrys sp.]